ncbi:hypothetical protein FHU38_005338 [Saccharomonospora amisosensis]|uniref:PPE family protein n=1 Tax=Saccharomonospora amisosensis TaxID=1128677 RepID=A0A7X5UVK3_9PSEU|nr:magnesium chelatase [Saccharomonospora amisosensis]NIJ14930.1 hypothetical protein [Saccharomonospora amisosensis]
MDNLDITALADRISSHRFDGYTDNMLADEIDRFRSGASTSGIADAVDALKAVAATLAETEATLRTELGKLGVRWQSQAGAEAGSAVAAQASFSEQAVEKVNDSAERIFAQGDAFSRTLHQLPDSQTLREGSGGYTTLDSMISLLGFETDNVVKVARAREAREQATRALNDYAALSGENLAGVRRLEAEPRPLRVETSPRVPSSIDAGGGPGDVTVAAGAGGTAPYPSKPAAPTAVTGGAGTPCPPSVAAAPVPPASAPAKGSGASSVPSPVSPATTAPSSAPPAAASAQPSGLPGPVGATPGKQPEQLRGAPPGSGAGVPIGPGSGASVPVERADGQLSAGISGAGQQPGRVGAAQGAVPPAAGIVGKPGAPGAGSPGDQQPEPLPKGKSFGAAPQPPGLQQGGLSGATTAGSVPRPGVSANDIGAGAAAIGAGGVAGALSGDGERRGRGVGRSAPGAARSPHQLAIGDLPEEESRAQRHSERLNPGHGERTTGFLERAGAAQGEADDAHVRRYGVDDSDLFGDDRMVAPDLIGDDDADGRL